MTLHTTTPPRHTTRSANDNGPLSSDQVKALKIAIVVMGVMILAMLLAIVARVIYLSTNKPHASASAPLAANIDAGAAALAPMHNFSLPPGARVRNMSLRGNRLLVQLDTNGTTRARIYDLTNGKLLSDVTFEPETPSRQ